MAHSPARPSLRSSSPNFSTEVRRAASTEVASRPNERVIRQPLPIRIAGAVRAVLVSGFLRFISQCASSRALAAARLSTRSRAPELLVAVPSAIAPENRSRIRHIAHLCSCERGDLLLVLGSDQEPEIRQYSKSLDRRGLKILWYRKTLRWGSGMPPWAESECSSSSKSAPSCQIPELPESRFT